ncbi:MAG: hypothetical protein Q7R30_04035 [Acidobacteriota bacterium]|nr:hypothetical protein [Acidobacteriota bacterium]
MPEKLSFSAFFGGRRQYDTPVATFTTAAGKQSARRSEGIRAHDSARRRLQAAPTKMGSSDPLAPPLH